MTAEEARKLATRMIAPRLGPARPVPGPPKRFAQAIGAVVTTAVVILTAYGQDTAAQALLVMIVVFAALESLLALGVVTGILNLHVAMWI